MVREGALGAGTQFPTFDAESKSAQNPNSLYGGGGLGGWHPTSNFDVKSKSTKNPNFPYGGRGTGT